MDELQQLLKNLHLSRMAERLPEELPRAEKEGLAYTDLLLRLVRAQWHHRQETALEWRIRQARLPERWALETFPFKDQPGVNKRQIMSLAELDFIPTATNLVFIGPTGVGKSGLAIGLLLKALQNGYRALFIKAQDLFDDLYASLADRSSRKLLDRLARVPLLCIDSCGVVSNVVLPYPGALGAGIRARHSTLLMLVTAPPATGGSWRCGAMRGDASGPWAAEPWRAPSASSRGRSPHTDSSC
jgi:DNA replication protein DnaC